MSESPNRIAQQRKAKGYSQKKFAELIGVSHPSLIKFEKGEIDKIPIGAARIMSKLLETPMSVLFDIEDFDPDKEELEKFKKEMWIEATKLEGYINQKDKHIALLEKQIGRKYIDILNSALAVGAMMDFFLHEKSKELELKEQNINLISEMIRAAHFVAMDDNFLTFFGTPEEIFRKEHGNDVPYPGEDPKVEYFRDVLKKISRYY